MKKRLMMLVLIIVALIDRYTVNKEHNNAPKAKLKPITLFTLPITHAMLSSLSRNSISILAGWETAPEKP
jgi:hypothetical protein